MMKKIQIQVQIQAWDSDSDIDDDKNVLFGNIVFNDGSQVTSDLSKIRNSAEKKSKKAQLIKILKLIYKN